MGKQTADSGDFIAAPNYNKISGFDCAGSSNYYRFSGSNENLLRPPREFDVAGIEKQMRF